MKVLYWDISIRVFFGLLLFWAKINSNIWDLFIEDENGFEEATKRIMTKNSLRNAGIVK